MPGKYILPNLESLAGQTMASSDYEVIYVDDGSGVGLLSIGMCSE